MTEATAQLLAKPFRNIRLTGVCRLGSRIALPDKTLLHAGPRFDDCASIPLPVINAAAQTLILDGTCKSMAEAQHLIVSGEVHLQPAQDHSVVTPLAQVVSQNSWVFEVTDGQQTIYAPLVEGPAPALRFGSADASCRQAMQAITSIAAPMQDEIASQGLDLEPVILAGLLGGDECHAVTKASHEALVVALPALAGQLKDKPWFVLPLLMAASSVALKAGGKLSAVGANGVKFGWKSPEMTHWRTVTAAAPVGQTMPSAGSAIALCAIGDSAVIDFAGLGAQALTFCPEMQQVWASHIPQQHRVNRQDVVDASTGLISPDLVLANRKTPGIHLAMVDAAGSGVLVGRGVYNPPVSVFAPSPASSEQGTA